MKIKDFLSFTRGWLGEFGGEEDLRFGKAENEITGITVCWMATMKAIKSAISHKHNLIIAHEDLLFPPDYGFRSSKIEPGILSKERMDILDRHGISMVRLHSTLDRLCILDDFARKLKLCEPAVKEDFYRVYEIEPTTLKKFAASVKKSLGLHQVRVTGNPAHKVKRVGGLWGGLGLSINACFIDKILSYSVDTVVAGETDEYAMRACTDLSIGMVEVGHEVSENIGLKNFTKVLRKKLPEIPVKFVPNPYPWQIF